jgi:Flp pilus assembly protein protease CpaA
MSLFTTAPLAVLCAFLAVAALIDSRTHKIPNWLTLIGGVLGLGLIALGEVALKNALIGFSAGFLVFFFLYILGIVGAGDVKLMGVSGLILGFPDIIIFLLLACLFSSALSLVYLILSGRGGLLIKDLSRIFAPFIKLFKKQSSKHVVSNVQGEAMVKMPFAPGAFIAALYFSYTYIPVVQVYNG